MMIASYYSNAPCVTFSNSYSISHAHVMGKTYAHDDAVTCMSVGKR